jgi:hypothetical protein
LEVSLSVESDLSGLDFSVFLIDLVTDQNDGNVVTYSGEVLVPFGDIFVGDSGGDIEHENGSIGANVIPFSEPTEFFLSSSIPEPELDGSVIGVESDGADLNPLSGDVFFFKLASDVSLDESSLTDTAVSDEYDFELSNDLGALHV